MDVKNKVPKIHKRPPESISFSTAGGKGFWRQCRCGELFFASRSFVRWCSNDCRKRFYHDHRAKVNGEWQILRKEKRNTLGYHTKWQWISKLKEMKFECYWCRQVMTRFEATKDHLIPISRGGTDNIDNIVPACWSCNSKKGPRTAEEYAAILDGFQQKHSSSTDPGFI